MSRVCVGTAAAWTNVALVQREQRLHVVLFALDFVGSFQDAGFDHRLRPKRQEKDVRTVLQSLTSFFVFSRSLFAASWRQAAGMEQAPPLFGLYIWLGEMIILNSGATRWPTKELTRQWTNGPLHGLWRQVFLQVSLQVLHRQGVGLGTVVRVLVVGVVQERARPRAHVVGRHHPAELGRQDLRMEQLVEAVQVVAVHEDLQRTGGGTQPGQAPLPQTRVDGGVLPASWSCL